MSDIDQELLSEFLEESRGIVADCESLLEDIENDPSQAGRLGEFANLIDRVMGAAKSLAMMAAPEHPLNIVGDITALCKAIGERGSNSARNEQLFTVTVAFLLDAVEITRELLDSLEDPDAVVTSDVRAAILDRVGMISNIYKQMPKDALVGDAGPKMEQNEIDEIMKKLGEM